ncbi:FadR/GntR family transcriptional regulator [Herbaspirillum sp. NPDC087042]|uniref:FadR/GntR family transcriptional regulator n=1 Tax=Herbaspirillum sp. NPDC087042 TaxID=3364004 RepID=UPI0038169EE6
MSDQVADHIVRYIAEHRLEPGQSLPSEGELTRILGVSRPTVREATNALVGRGLIAVSSGKTPIVLGLSKAPFSNLVRHGLATQQVTPTQILEVRHSLELQAAALAALHRSETDIECLNLITAQMPAAVGDVEKFSPLDAAFHEAIARATQNVLLSAIIMGLGEITFESARSGLARARDQAEWDIVLSTHLELAEAIIKGNAALARKRVDAHFKAAFGRYT